MLQDKILQVQDAARIAFDYLQQLYNSDEVTPLMLEEVELSDDEKYWFITFSLSRKLPPPPQSKLSKLTEQATSLLTTPKVETIYKVIKVDAKTGDVLSMKIREI